MCELLEVSCSGYYKWRKSRERGPTPTQQRRAELDAKVAKFHAESDAVYGATRILVDLRDDGEHGCSRRVIGWAIDDYLHTDLVQAAPEMAMAMRGELAEQVMLHADHGCQVHLSTARAVRL
ncbi:hypothetical protein ACX9NE_28595 [Mycobacterium sp. ML4]